MSDQELKTHLSHFLSGAALALRQERSELLGMLTASQRQSIGQLIAQFIVSPAPDYYASAAAIDGILSAPQRQRVLAIERENMQRMYGTLLGAMPSANLPTPDPARIEKLLHQQSPGGWLLQTLLTNAMGADPAVINRGLNELQGNPPIPR